MTQLRSSMLPTDSGVEGEPDRALELESDLGVENEIARGRRLADPGREPSNSENDCHY